jgi:hypothetical protein
MWVSLPAWSATASAHSLSLWPRADGDAGVHIEVFVPFGVVQIAAFAMGKDDVGPAIRLQDILGFILDYFLGIHELVLLIIAISLLFR